jgi:hypothetical protein
MVAPQLNRPLPQIEFYTRRESGNKKRPKGAGKPLGLHEAGDPIIQAFCEID